MTRFVSTSIALFCGLALFASFAFVGCSGPQTNTNANGNAALASPAPAFNCSGATHDQILKAVYDAIGNNKTYAAQVWQFNITENAKKLTILGWSPDHAGIANLVGQTAVGCTVDASNFVPKPADLGANNRLIRSCPQGYPPCGDVCIPIGDHCMLTNDTPMGSHYNCTPSGTPTPSPTGNANSVVNGNGNMNKPK